MVDAKFARQLFTQFRGMPGEPSGEHASREINSRVDVLAGRSRSEAHCDAVVQRMLETLHFFPTVADIVQTADNVLDPQSQAAISRSRQCPHCRGDGWITKQAPFGVDVAYPCDHTGRIPESKGITMSAELQNRYLREMEDSAERERKFHELRAAGKIDPFEKQSAQKRREMVRAQPPPIPPRMAPVAPPPTPSEIEAIKAAQQRAASNRTQEVKQ